MERIKRMRGEREKGRQGDREKWRRHGEGEVEEKRRRRYMSIYSVLIG